MAFTPEQAAVSSIQNVPGSQNAAPSRIEVRQKVELGAKTFVLFTFERAEEGRNDRCIQLYAVEKGRFGTWFAGSGGGGCTGHAGGGSDPAAEQPIEMNSGSASGDRSTDPGYSYISGLVHDNNIRQARITWEDGATQEVDVINGSLLAVRAGVVNYRAVEGIDASGEVIYNADFPSAAPGKR